MSKSDLDSEWLEALEVEEPDTPPEEPNTNEDGHDEEAPDGDSGDDQAGDDDAGQADDSEEQEGDSDDDSEGDTPPSDGEADDEPKADDEGKEEPKEQLDTKEAVKEALKEIETSKVEQSAKVETYKSEVTKALYPEGIDRTLRDADGDPINGIEDLTRLINPKTQDYFTDEEAGAWLLNAQQKLNKDVETVERFIEEVAETNLQIEEGANRVAEKYGDILSKDPDLRERLLAGYNKTLVKDPNTGVAIKAPVDVEEFFGLALDPLISQRAAEAEAAAKAAKEAEQRAAKNRQSERGDFKPSGKAETIPEADKEWAEAIKAYEEGA